jgi:hypothetical protein
MNCATYEDNKSKSKKIYFVAGLDDHSQLYYINKKFEIARSYSYSDQNENGNLYVSYQAFLHVF